MRKWFTTLSLVMVLLGGAVAGAGTHESEGSCPMSNMPDCCKRAHSNSNSPQAAMARLCCSLNCSEPGSSGSTSYSSSSSVTPASDVMPHIEFNDIAVVSYYSSTPHRADSSPKYIQHLALLI
jgi:hypothetical protein